MPTQRCPICERDFYQHHGRTHKRICCSEQCRRERDEARYVVKRTLSAVDAAYLAGLVDGEGTISVWRERRRENVTGWRYKTTFTIAQANGPFLQEIRQMVGNGNVYSNGPRKQNH